MRQHLEIGDIPERNIEVSHYYDTSSRAVEQPVSEFTAPEDDHCPTESREKRGFLIKAYGLMYGSGLAWIAAIVAWAFTLVHVAAILLLSLAWTATSAIGSRADAPDLNMLQAGVTLIAALGVTGIALWMTVGFRRMLNHSPAYGVAR